MWACAPPAIARPARSSSRVSLQGRRLARSAAAPRAAPDAALRPPARAPLPRPRHPSRRPPLSPGARSRPQTRIPRRSCGMLPVRAPPLARHALLVCIRVVAPTLPASSASSPAPPARSSLPGRLIGWGSSPAAESGPAGVSTAVSARRRGNMIAVTESSEPPTLSTRGSAPGVGRAAGGTHWREPPDSEAALRAASRVPCVPPPLSRDCCILSLANLRDAAGQLPGGCLPCSLFPRPIPGPPKRTSRNALSSLS